MVGQSTYDTSFCMNRRFIPSSPLPCLIAVIFKGVPLICILKTGPCGPELIWHWKREKKKKLGTIEI